MAQPTRLETIDHHDAMDDSRDAARVTDVLKFGRPTLHGANIGRAEWVRGQQLDSTFQKGSNGWLAYFYGGIQSGDDYGAVYIPGDEVPLTDLSSALWSYFMSATEAAGVNMVIWVHDPADFDLRAEITQVPGKVDFAAGWQAHELDTSVQQFFYYGEISGTPDTTPTAGTQYTLAQFQADSIFKTYTIYRISFEYGWIGSTTLDAAYLADVKINGQMIPLGPPSGKHKKDVLQTKTIIGGAATANDVISENASTGTDWDFNFGGTGYITKGVVTIATHGLTERLRLRLYSVPPTSTQLDNAADTGPLAADIPNLVGWIDFPPMTDTSAAGVSYTMATPSTTGNLPIAFDAYTLYGTLIGLDGGTLGNVLCSIHLFGDMEDN